MSTFETLVRSLSKSEKDALDYQEVRLFNKIPKTGILASELHVWSVLGRKAFKEKIMNLYLKGCFRISPVEDKGVITDFKIFKGILLK